MRHVAVPFGIRKPRGYREEPSQRTRALVFLVLGIATALQAGTDTLWVYENGIGALNLPLNETQLGIDNYRGVHPRFLMLAQDFLSLALDQPMHIRNPFQFSTKAQMCKSLVGSGIAEAVSHTVSCDGFPQRIPQPAISMWPLHFLHTSPAVPPSQWIGKVRPWIPLRYAQAPSEADGETSLRPRSNAWSGPQDRPLP